MIKATSPEFEYFQTVRFDTSYHIARTVSRTRRKDRLGARLRQHCLVQMYRLAALLAHMDVEHLHHDREIHGKVDLALWERVGLRETDMTIRLFIFRGGAKRHVL